MDPRFEPDRDATDRGPVGHQDAETEGVLPSRAGALAECRTALIAGRGPALLTGEAGSGKTWLWRHLAGSATGLGQWLGLDAHPSDDGQALARRLLRGIGRANSAAVDDPGAALADELLEQSEDGRRWVFVLDEAQNASDAALEQFRLLSNRLGRPDGFGGMMLVGRTGLALRLRARHWASLESRLATHARVTPIDAEEAALLLSWAFSEVSWDRARVEALHIRSLGTPTRLLRLADRVVARSVAPTSPAPIHPHRSEPEPVVPPRSDRVARASRPEPAVVMPAPGPALVEVRPPLRYEDGLIEVGWEGVDEPVADVPTVLPTEWGDDRSDRHSPKRKAVGLLEDPAAPRTEAIDDPYAAIQARSEWSLAVETASLVGEVVADASEDEPEGGEGDAVTRRVGQVRAEAGQDFAPYGRLFSQLNSSSDSG